MYKVIAMVLGALGLFVTGGYTIIVMTLWLRAKGTDIFAGYPVEQ